MANLADHRHLPAHTIDRMLAELCSADEAVAIQSSAEACADCRGRLESARQARESFLARHPPAVQARALLAEHGRRSTSWWHRRWWVPVLSTAALASGVLLWVRPTAGPEGAREQITAKGSAPTLGFSVRRAGRPTPEPGADGQTLRAGDVLELSLVPGDYTDVHVFAVGGDGRPQPLLDWRPGQGRPPTLTLDDQPGPDSGGRHLPRRRRRSPGPCPGGGARACRG